MGRPEVSGLGTFRITLVRPLHFYDVPTKIPVGNFRWHQPTATLRLNASRSFNRRNTLAACVPLRDAVFWAIVTPVRCGAPTFTLGTVAPAFTQMRLLERSAPKPANCWLLLAINLEPIPASLYHPVMTEFTARCMACACDAWISW